MVPQSPEQCPARAQNPVNIPWPLRWCGSTLQFTDEKTCSRRCIFPTVGTGPRASSLLWKALSYFSLPLWWLTLGPERHFWNKNLGSNAVSKKSKGSGRGGKSRVARLKKNARHQLILKLRRNKSYFSISLPRATFGACFCNIKSHCYILR